MARACLAQFGEVNAIEHIWPLIRTEGQLDRVIHNIEQNPGIVLYTVINADIRHALEEGCRRLQVPPYPCA